jgi:MerR family transcriptional regulator/heat shock protein HspR
MAEREISGPRVTAVRGANMGGPAYAISVAARMVGVHAQTLRYYERVGLVEPARSRGNIRMYSALDVQQARWIRSLIDDLGMNLAGVDVIIRMSAQMTDLEQEVLRLRSELAGRS